MEKRKQQMEDIWHEYHPKLQLYLKQLFPNIINLEDRVSDVLLKVYEQLDKYNSKYSISTWIYMIARNSQIDEIRKSKIQFYDTEIEQIDDQNSPEDLFFKKYTEEVISECIKKLNPRERELIYLYYFEEFTIKEISKITKTPEGTIKFRMHSSKGKLRTLLNREALYETNN